MNSNEEKDALQLCKDAIVGFKSKAKHNKSESLWCFRIVMGFTLIAPLFVTLGDGVVLGKLLPSALSICAAFATAWIQLRKPQQLWALYRTCQRELEDHKTKYEFRIDGYSDCDDAEKLLAKNVAEISLDAHYKWLPIVPNPESLQEINAPENEA